MTAVEPGGSPPFALVGPTASGKTEASIPLARRLGAEILCVDSMLVYRGMDVGTAKPSPAQRREVPHHLLDLVEPAQPFSVAEFQAHAKEALATLARRHRAALLVGGSGLYYRAIVDSLEFPGTDLPTRSLLESEARAAGGLALHARLLDLDPAAARQIDPSNVRRSIRALEVAAVTGRPFSSFSRAWTRYPPGTVRAAGVDMPRSILHDRIEQRVAHMMPGLLDEADRLASGGLAGFITSTQAIGYGEALAALKGSIGPEEASSRIVARTKALSRRQMAWFRRDPRIVWVRVGEDGAVGALDELFEVMTGGTPKATAAAATGAV